MFPRCTAIFAAILFTAAAAAQGVPWLRDYAAAQRVALDTDRLIMIDFYTEWCGPCKMLDQNTWPHALVAAESANIAPVKLEAEKNKDGVKLAEKYKVEAYPTILFIDKSGAEMGRFVGFAPPEEMSSNIAGVVQRYREDAKVDAAIKAKPEDGENNAKFVLVALGRDEVDKAVAAAKKLADSKYKGAMRARAFAALGSRYLAEKKWDDAVKYFGLAKENTKGAYDKAIALMGLLKSYEGQGKKERVVEVAKELQKLPGAPENWAKFARTKAD